MSFTMSLVYIRYALYTIYIYYKSININVKRTKKRRLTVLYLADNFMMSLTDISKNEGFSNSHRNSLRRAYYCSD